ncbi:MAG: hypothetical protein ACYC7E_22095 [Armatimonadota bacterium]
MECNLRHVLREFRQLPEGMLVMHVGGKSLFSFGLGTILAASMKGNWKIIGWLAMLFGVIMGLPSGMKVMGKVMSR